MSTPQTIQEQLASPTIVTAVRDWLQHNKGKGRAALARHLCQQLALRDRLGKLRLAGVLKALRVLESRGRWRLPTHRTTSVRQRSRPRRLSTAVASPHQVPPRVEQVKGLCLIEVGSEDDERFRTWNELILTEHPLHDCRLVGRQVRYLIGSDHGWLGAIGFGSCALRMRARDAWIGWDQATRKGFQDRLINMTRLLIRPQVQCDNLASRVLSLCVARVGKDFAARYGFEPWLVESFVDTEQYSGACYRAANWWWVGATAGRGRSAPSRPTKTRKSLYLYALTRDWRSRMGIPARSERIQPVSLEEAVQNGRWVDAEFGGVDFGHEVARQRLVRIASAKAQNPSASYTECVAGDRHQLKAYYRFIGNERTSIDPRGILTGHRERTLGRMKERERVLVVQDTTDLDFSQRLHCNGLGDIGKNQTGAVSHGLKMHSSLVVGEDGLPLGVLDVGIYASHFHEAKRPQNRPIDEKESYRWLRTLDDLDHLAESIPNTELLCVGDRESDIFELFDHRRRKKGHIQLLVRARDHRCLEGQARKLFDHLNTVPPLAEATIQVPRQREKTSTPSRPGQVALPARTARVQLTWDTVTLAAPDTPPTRHVRPVELYALSVFEPHPPVGAKALHWVLLTTVPILSRKLALRCLRWYTLRWRIEEWHRVLKSGCRIESHQHRSADKLARAIAIDAVLAWRVMLLALLGREVPDIPCALVFSSWECTLLERLQPLGAPETIGGQKKRPAHRNRRGDDQPSRGRPEQKREGSSRATDTLTRA